MVFDVSKHVLGREAREATLSVGSDFLTLKIRNVPWAKKNQLLSLCLSWDEKGSHFDTDTYVRECLKYMIAEAPWGVTNDLFLSSLDEELGKALETLVPKAFGASSPALDKNEVKKE